MVSKPMRAPADSADSRRRHEDAKHAQRRSDDEAAMSAHESLSMGARTRLALLLGTSYVNLLTQPSRAGGQPWDAGRLGDAYHACQVRARQVRGGTSVSAG